MQRRLEQRAYEDEYLLDERDALEGEVTDSDQEFDAIVDVDRLIKEIGEVHAIHVQDEESVRNYHERMVLLMRQMHEITELLEFENQDLWKTFDEIIAQELFDIGNLDWIAEMARLAHEMELPYRAFWGAMVNIALLKH